MNSMPWYPFLWEGTTLGDRYFPHAAMYVKGVLPSLDDLTGLYQFDLGAPVSMLYGWAFTTEQRARLEARRMPERKVILNGKVYPRLDVELRIGPWSMDDGVAWFTDFGDAEPSIEGYPTLGTLGADFVRDTVLALDYPGQRLARLDDLPPAWEEKARWVPMRILDTGLMMIQLHVEGEPMWMGFDTGSSIFHLLTDDKYWAMWTDGAIQERLSIPAWGEMITVYGAVPRVSFSQGGEPLEIPLIYRRSDPQWSRFLQHFEAGGLMGNAPFLDKMIILDFPRQRFGLLA